MLNTSGTHLPDSNWMFDPVADSTLLADAWYACYLNTSASRAWA
jgi:hypothetical protein